MRLQPITTFPPNFASPVIERRRLTPHFAFGAGVRIVVLLAPAGYGKSLALRSALAGDRWIHYRVGGRTCTFGGFARGFAQAVATVAPGAAASFPRAWERALQSDAPHTVLARWLCEHLARCDVDIAIDDLHEAADDVAIAEFIAEFARLRPGRRLAIAARSAGALPIPLWMATGVMEAPIPAEDLAFDADEIRELARAYGVEDAAGDAVRANAHGCPIAVAYALRSATRGERAAVAAGSFAELADHLFAARSPRQRQFLLSASLLPALEPEALAACGWTDWPALFAAMKHDAAFMWEIHEGVARFHDGFASYLTERMDSLEPSLRETLAERVVTVLRAAGQHGDALRAAIAERRVGAIAALLEAHGFDILESGRVDEIGAALAILDDAGCASGAAATAIRGYIEARLGRLDTAEAWFGQGLARAETEASRVAIALYYAREIMHRLRDDAFGVLEPYANSPTLSRDLLIDVRSSLSQAYMLAERGPEARHYMALALDMLAGDCPAVLRARVLARAAYVAVESGEWAAARGYAQSAAPIAVAEGLYDVATSVYTVLYTLAYEVDDDPAACLEYLARVRDYGVKSGTLRLDAYALVATYELLAEAGDRGGLAVLERQIGDLDVTHATPSFLESFLPARALQAGWRGDFVAACAMLAPTPERQWTPLRRGLRWSEVALYAAAAGDADGARAAAQAAHGAIAEAAGARTTHLAYAGLYCSLALYVLGDRPAAQVWLAEAAAGMLDGAARMQALYAAVACLVGADVEQVSLATQLTARLADLDACGFGGMAELIRSLPNGALASAAAPTIGALLAREELDRRYAAAVASAADEAGLYDWLRRAADADASARSAVLALRAWSRPAGADGPRAFAIAQRVFALRASRVGGPAHIASYGGEVDVDARIDLLFADLKSAAPLMAEHSAAVSAWCARIARRLGLSEKEIVYVRRAGLIHDIGKVTTPDSILNAPRQLTAAEWDVMRDHAAAGGRIAAEVPELITFIPIVRGHHERLDGRGYPDGLRLSAIPLAARIVTVADCFNAMIGRRAYRPPMVPTNALDELDRNRGKQFDPEIVDAMISIVTSATASVRAYPTATNSPISVK